MSDPIPDPAPISPAPAQPKLDPVAVFSALGSEFRWPVVQRLAAGPGMSVSEIAAAFGRDFDGVGRHMKVLRDAGVLEAFAGEDRRLKVYGIPERFRAKPGVLDFGVATVTLGLP